MPKIQPASVKPAAKPNPLAKPPAKPIASKPTTPKPESKPAKIPALGKATLPTAANGEYGSLDSSRILYPDIEIKICKGEKAIDVTLAKKLMGWESEDEYAERTQSKPEWGTSFLLKDEDGKKIRCWNNNVNRPFKESHSRALAQDILNRNWELNLENIIISRTGKVTSGQHRLIGLILAYQMWCGVNKHRWEEKWPTEPVIESLIAFGGSDDPRVLRTIDNVMPRSLGDVFYTSELFAELQSVEKRECSRMLDGAVNFLWKRTGADKQAGNKYQTHSSSVDFMGRHPKLLECVKIIFNENKERKISVLRLSPGQSAAVLYMMGACATDGDLYYNADPPSEKEIDWEHWEKALEFWKRLGDNEDETLKAVATTLGSLVDEDTGAGGRLIEKMVVLAKGWNKFLEDREISEESMALEYTEPDVHGVKHLHPDEWIDFAGIDRGEKPAEPELEDDPEEIEKRKEEEKQKRAEQLKENLEKARAKKLENKAAASVSKAKKK